MRVERVQPGYDHLANDYDKAFPTPFHTALERRAVEAWRTVSRPDAEHRFPECHLLATR